jgi:predicted amino acid-binding ACT domain protein
VTVSHRLRVQLLDRPGALAQLATLVAEHGGNVRSVDIHVLDDDRAVDELVVTLPDDWDERAFDAQLAAAGVGRLLSCRAKHGATDRVTRVLEWATAVVQSGVGYSELELSRTIAELCSADVAWVASPDEAATTDAGQRALATRRAIVELSDSLPVQLTDGTARPGWLMVVPDDGDQPRAVAFAARLDGHQFTTTELSRLRALLGLHRELAVIAQLTTRTRPDAGSTST